MKLECTKKLLDYFGAKPKKSDAEPAADPFFSWTANLITTNRRKTIVVVNQASRCLFVLHGIRVKHIAEMPALLLDGIRALLQSEFVRPEVIEKYLDDCGRSVTYAPNTSRSTVALCNKSCERVSYFSNLFVADDMFQKQLLPWLNDNLQPKADYRHSFEILLEKLKERYGEPVQSCRAAEVEVTLSLHTPCKRTLIVPGNLNFYQFHSVLQNAFEWKDEHLHQFVLETDRYGRLVKLIGLIGGEEFLFDDVPPVTQLDSLETEVGAILETYGTIEYEYDFGSGWVHTITLKRMIEDCADPYPHCTNAVGDAPMEDCGGPEGFAEIMEIMADPAHPAHQSVCEWVRRTWWNPVDLEQINRRLRNRYRISMPVTYR